jgi:hypothetical protein
MNEQILQTYLKNADIIMAETGTYSDYVDLKNNPSEENLVLIFMLGYFAANQYYTNKVKELLRERKMEFKLSEIHNIIKEISGKPLN